MADRSIHVASLCSGIGGLDLGLQLALGGRCRTVVYVEREVFTAAILAARMQDAALAAAPVWSDLRTFDGRPWRGRVDVVTGGYPCQPFSFAGKRRGQDDPRHLWPSIARIVAEIQPGVVFFENVAGHLSLGFYDVRRELEGLGYRVTAGLFAASEVGAPHRRERLFILGVLDDAASPRRIAARIGTEADSGGGQCVFGERRPGLADAGGERPQGQRGSGPAAGPTGRGDGALADAREPDVRDAEAGRCDGSGEPSASTGGSVADAAGGRRREPEPEPGAYWRAPDRGPGGGDDLPVFPPGPGAVELWRQILAVRPDLAPAVEPRVRGVADGTPAGLDELHAGRLDRLRALGNGVVPACAARAFVTLWACLQE